MKTTLAATIIFLLFLEVTCYTSLSQFQFDQKNRIKQNERNRQEHNEAIRRNLDALYKNIKPVNEEFGIPEETVEGLETLLEVADTNKDGMLSMQEMKDLVDTRKVLTEKQLQELLDEADINKDGGLTIKELAGYMARNGLPVRKAVNTFDMEKFKLMDLNKDEYIDMVELQRIYKYCNQDFNRQVIQKILKAADKNKDHRLDFTEMKNLLQSADVLTDGGVEDPNAEIFNRVKSCVATFIERCKDGCNRPVSAFKKGYVHISQVVQMPFMLSSSISTPFYKFSG